MFCHPLFRFGERTGDVDHDDLSATGADNMIIVLRRIVQFVIAARSLKIHLVHEVQAIKESDHAKNGGIIGAGASQSGELLDFLQ